MPPASNRHPFHYSKQLGVGLLEVLVAVFILSIGFLGMAALQAKSLSTNNSAVARSMATIDSYSILEAMRADIANAQAGSYNKTVQADTCPTDTSTLAKSQLVQWCTQLGADFGQFSSTKGTISCDASGSGYCTIAIQFDDSRAGAAGSSTQTFTTKAVL